MDLESFAQLPLPCRIIGAAERFFIDVATGKYIEPVREGKR